MVPHEYAPPRLSHLSQADEALRTVENVRLEQIKEDQIQMKNKIFFSFIY
jgi:hypothetical protein